MDRAINNFNTFMFGSERRQSQASRRPDFSQTEMTTNKIMKRFYLLMSIKLTPIDN